MYILKKLLFLILPLAVFANQIEFTEQEKNFIASNPQVKIALMPDFTPFSFFTDGEVVGFENELLELLSAKTGLKFIKHYDVWNKNLAAFKSKKVDMIASISHKKEREPFTLFTEPYYEIPIMIFVRDDFGSYKNLSSLEGKKVGVLKEVFYIKELKKLKNLELVVYETYEEITKALVFGKIDALIQNLPNINYLIKKNLYSNLQLADELKLPDINKEDLRFGIDMEKPLLHSIIQKALDNLSKQEMQNLTDRWIDVKYNNYTAQAGKYTNRLEKTIFLDDEEKEYLKAKTVNYCIDPNWEPFEYIDEKGNHNGLTKDYLENIILKTGMKTKLVKTKNWSQTIEFLKNKKCDMILKISATPSLKEYLNFTEPYLKFPQVVVMNQNASFVASMDDIIDKKVAMVEDYAIVEIIKLKYPNFNPVTVSCAKEGLKSVANSKVDAFVDFLPSVSRGINQLFEGNLKIAGKIDETILLGAASRNDDPVLNRILQKALKSFKPEEHKAILDKWMTVKFEYGTDYTLVWKVSAVTLFLLAVFGYWNHKIREAKKVIEKQNKQLELLASTDKLTKIYNRAKLDELLSIEIDRGERYGYSFGCAVIDVDNFKKINDNFGHLTGDEVLKRISQIIKSNIRDSDYFGRWGGEEFLLILPQVDKNNLFYLLEKIRKSIQDDKSFQDFTITVSTGATVYGKNDTIDSIIKRADDKLYEAKNSGKNKVLIG